MDKIIAISGKQFAGKDTLCLLLLKYLPDYRRVALADALKDEYAQIRGITREEVDALKARDPKVRGELIALGKKRREEDKDYWVKKVLEQPGNKIVTDLRFLNELERFLEHKAFTIRIDAKRAIRAQRGTLCHETDPSETELDDITTWRIVTHNNSSVEALDKKVKQIAQVIKTGFGQYSRPPKQKMSLLDGLLLSFLMDMELFFSRQVERFAKYLRTQV
jgi:phosphomevalonate kinase